jgi:hypothetical protein
MTRYPDWIEDARNSGNYYVDKIDVRIIMRLYDRIKKLEEQSDELKLRMEVALGSTKANNSWTRLMEEWIKTLKEKHGA